jgi:hypothetical protein
MTRLPRAAAAAIKAVLVRAAAAIRGWGGVTVLEHWHISQKFVCPLPRLIESSLQQYCVRGWREDGCEEDEEIGEEGIQTNLV